MVVDIGTRPAEPDIQGGPGKDKIVASIFLLFVFCGMQAIAQLLFKYGSLHQNRWLLFFVLGNMLGASSIWLLMLLYKHMNVNVALALAGGGAFISCQVALAIFHRSRLTLSQTLGVLGIALCMVFVTPGQKRPVDPPTGDSHIISSDEGMTQ